MATGGPGRCGPAGILGGAGGQAGQDGGENGAAMNGGPRAKGHWVLFKEKLLKIKEERQN